MRHFQGDQNHIHPFQGCSLRRKPMSSAMMMERTAMSMPGMPMPSMTGHGMPTSSPMQATPSYVMVPRCTFKMEKCNGGMKITCHCDDEQSCTMVQNLCASLMGGMVSCCMMMNGMVVCCCNLTMGMCKCETTKKGVCITYTSGDAKCCEMIQACCECMACMLKDGCMCCMMMSGTPVCCGSC